MYVRLFGLVEVGETDAGQGIAHTGLKPMLGGDDSDQVLQRHLIKGAGLVCFAWLSMTLLELEGVDVAANRRLAEEAWTLLQIGLGGYVVGRSAEKIIPRVTEVMGKP